MTSRTIAARLVRLSSLAAHSRLTLDERARVKGLLLSRKPDARAEAAFDAATGDDDLAESLRALLGQDAQLRASDGNAGAVAAAAGPTRGNGGASPANAHPPDAVVLFAAREMAEVAAEMKARFPERYSLGSISWERFDEPEGWPNVFIADALSLPHHECMFLASFHTPSVVFEQLSAVYALTRYGAKKLTVVVPFFATGTMERVEKVGEVATAAVLARLLSITPPCAEGPTQLVILDIHALQERFYFSDNVIVHLKSCVRMLIDELAALPINEREKLCIVFPDDGAWKRFHTKFEKDFPIVVCHKIRDGDKRAVRVRDGLEFVSGGHCVIVDDLVKSGGTLIEAAAVLQQAGARLISAYVTHGVFPANTWKKFVRGTPENKINMHRFWMTDSIPTTAAMVKNKEPFKVLSVAPVISQFKSAYDDGRYD